MTEETVPQDVAKLQLWTKRYGYMLGFALLLQLAVAFFFQDFRASFAHASAFSASGQAPAAFAMSGSRPILADGGTSRRAFAPPAARRFAAPANGTSLGRSPVAAAPVANVVPDAGAPAGDSGTARPGATRFPELAQNDPVRPSGTPFRSPPPSAPAIGDGSGGGASPAPEPSEWIMLMLGFGVIGWMLRRQHAASANAVEPQEA